jgi:hypothetical protein
MQTLPQAIREPLADKALQKLLTLLRRGPHHIGFDALIVSSE